MNKIPPDKDKYKCLKVNILSILNNKDTISIIEDAVFRTNNITFKAYLLLKLWILSKYHNNIEIPKITVDIIKMAFKSIIIKSSGPKVKNDNLILLNEFNVLHSFSLENGKNLSQILGYYATTMLTCIENNIKMHFMDYINRFVDVYFKFEYKNELENIEFKKQLFTELIMVKNDIKNDTLKCDIKYHNWLKIYRYNIVPKEYNISYFYDLKVNPTKYLKYMIFMNTIIESREGKTFQVFPLQTSMVPKNIQLDTKSIVELIVTKDKKEYLDNILAYKEILWDEYFSIPQKIKGYSFDFTIITDGYSTSLRFINNNQIEKDNLKKSNMRICKNKMKGMTSEEKKIFKNNKVKPVKVTVETNKEDTLEFQYIDDVPKEELYGKHIFIDPGKRSLLTMMDDEGNFLSYTNGKRMKMTKRLEYQNRIKKYKDKNGITKIENELTNYSSKTCCIKKYEEYIIKKVEVSEKINNKYRETKFRQYKWYSYINRKRTEDKMLNEIENKYGKESIIIIGDWSISKQMRNFISTPNLSIKRKLKERFRVFDIDEYRTSKLNYKTEEECENIYLPDKENKQRKKHSILTYQMENKRKGCINRDKNGCKNIQKIYECYIETGERPYNYRRQTKNVLTSERYQTSNSTMPKACSTPGHLHPVHFKRGTTE